MSVPRSTGEGAQRDQSQQGPAPAPQAPAATLGTAVHIPSSHTFIPLQQFSFTPTETLAIRNPDDNNNKPVTVVAQQQQHQQLPVVSVVAAVSGLCPPALPVHSMQPAVVSGVAGPTIIPTVVTPMTVHAAAAAAAGLTPTTSMAMSSTLNMSNHLSVAAAAQQQYQALNSTAAAGLNLMTNPGGLNLASAIKNLNSNILANNISTSVSNNSSPSSTSSESKSNTKSSTTIHTNNNSGSNMTATTNSTKSSNSNKSPGGSSAPTKSGSSTKNSSSSSTSSSSTQSSGSSTEPPDDLVKPVFKDGELVLEVECGQNKGILYLSKLCQGSKGPCISFQTSWLTPNEFQFVSGRETAKDWKRSIRHHGKSLKLLLAKGILNVHPTMCDCDGCRQGATLTRKGEKRRIPNGDRKPRKLSGGNAGNGNSAGHAGTGAGAGAFRPVGGTPTVASHLTSPGGALAKPEAKRSGGDKQLKITTAGAAQASPDQSSPKDTGVASQKDLKSQASAYLDSFNLLGVTHKPKPAATPLPPLELTSPPADAVTGQQSPALSSPASSSSIHSSLGSPPAPLSPDTDRNVSEVSLKPEAPAVATVDVSMREEPATTAGESDNTESSEMEEATTPSAELDVSKVTDPSTASSDETKPLEEGIVADASNRISEDNGGEGAKDVAEKVMPGLHVREEHVTKPDTADELQAKADLDSDPNQSSDIQSTSARSTTVDTLNPTSSSHGDSGDVGGEKTNIGEAEEKEEKPSDGSLTCPSSNVTNVSGSYCPTPTKPHPYGISAILGSSLTDSSSNSNTLTPSTAAASPDKPVTLQQASKSAEVGGASCQPVTVSAPPNNVKSEHIWIPPTLSPTSGGAAAMLPRRSASDHHTSSNNNICNNISSKSSVKSLPSPSPSLPLHTSTKPESSTSSSSSTTRYNSSSSTNNNLSCQQGPKSQEASPAITPSAEVTNYAHGLKHTPSSATPGALEKFGARREPSAAGKPERDREASGSTLGMALSSHLSASAEKNAASREREREERQRQRAREERNRKDREREERRERERREEKEAERKRQEDKEKRGGVQGESSSKQDGGSAATPGIGGSSSSSSSTDAARRAPGGLADAAAFSDYMRVLAAGHGHALIPPTAAGYMPTLYGLRPQDTAAAYSQLLHPMSMYGPAATAQAGGMPKDAASSLALFPGFGSLQPLLAARAQYAGAGPTLLDYQRSLAAASSASTSGSPYAAWPAAAYPYLLPELMAASSPHAMTAAAAAAGVKRHSSEMEAAMELSAKRMRLEGRPGEFTSPWDYFAAAAAASQHHQHQQHQQQQHHHHQQQQQQRAAAAFGHPGLSCGLESATSFDKSNGSGGGGSSSSRSNEYLRKRYLEYAASHPHAAAYLSALPEYARTMSVYGQPALCPEHRDQDIRLWGVEDVCKFLTTLEGCAVYAEHFREQRVDGRILSLLSSEHLVKTLGMKLGPALFLAEAVAKRLQDLSKMAGCEACRAASISSMQAMQALHPMMSLPM